MSYPAARPRRSSARAIGVSPATTIRGAASCGSRKISSDPPLRHGLWATTTPSRASSSAAPPGSSRSSSASPVSSARAAYRRTEACAHTPPTKPSMVPSASTSAESPGRTLAGLAARTTVAVTNGTRSATSRAIRSMSSPLIIVMPAGSRTRSRLAEVIVDGDVDGLAAPALDAHALGHALQRHRVREQVAALHAHVVIRAVSAKDGPAGVLLQRGAAVGRHLPRPHGAHDHALHLKSP